MAFLKRLIRALPLLVLSPFLMAISFLALSLVQLFTRRGGKLGRKWHKAQPCAGERSSPGPSFGRMDKAEPYPTAATVVIPNWNGKDLLAKYIPSIRTALAELGKGTCPQ